MSTNEMDLTIKELRELRRMQEELAAEIENLQDQLKAEMTSRNTEELTGTDWKVTWKPVTSNRLDTTALKKAAPDLCERFMKKTTSRRFVLA